MADLPADSQVSEALRAAQAGDQEAVAGSWPWANLDATPGQSDRQPDHDAAGIQSDIRERAMPPLHEALQ
jgi:hypothetical protein